MNENSRVWWFIGHGEVCPFRLECRSVENSRIRDCGRELGIIDKDLHCL